MQTLFPLQVFGGLTLASSQTSTQLLSHSPVLANRMRKLMDQEKGSEIAYQLPSQAKQTQLGENEFNIVPVRTDLGGEKGQMIHHHLSFPLFPGSTSLLRSQLLSPLPAPQMGLVRGYSQYITIFFSAAPFFSHFPPAAAWAPPRARGLQLITTFSSMGSPWAAAWTSSLPWSTFSSSSFLHLGVPSAVSHPLTLLLSLCDVSPFLKYAFPEVSPPAVPCNRCTGGWWQGCVQHGAAPGLFPQPLPLQPPVPPLPPDLDN